MSDDQANMRSLQDTLDLAAMQIGRLYEQRELLRDALDGVLREHSKPDCTPCRKALHVLGEVERLKKKYG
jgi:hypothetical protein